MSDARLDFLVLTTMGTPGTLHPRLWGEGPRWDMTASDLYADPEAAGLFARRIAVVCHPTVTTRLAEALEARRRRSRPTGHETVFAQVVAGERGVAVPSREAASRGEEEASGNRVIAELVDAIARRFSEPALGALQTWLRTPVATHAVPPVADPPLTLADLEFFSDDRSVEARDFASLGEDVERESAEFAGKEARVLHDRWTAPAWHPEFAERAADFKAWQESLTPHAVAEYCAAAGAAIRGALLDASTPDHLVGGRIEHLRSEPSLVVYARPGTALAADAGLARTGGTVRIGPLELGQQVAMYGGAGPVAGEFAWRSVSWWLAEHESILPRLAVRATGADAAEVELLTEGPAPSGRPAPSQA